MTPTAAKTASAGDIIDVVAEERAAMRDAARAALGVTGRDSVMPLRMALREAGVGLYPAFALCALVIVDQFQLSAFSVLSPDVSNSLGLSQTIFSGIYALRMFALSAMAMPMAALVQRRPRRALVAVTTAFAWAFMTMFTGFAGGLLALLAVFVLDGASSGSVQATHPGLLFDRYPTNVRSRLFSLYTSSTYAALVLAPGLVALLTWLDLTWRGVFLVLGAVCVLVAVLGVGLRDPGFGGLDTRQVRELVSEDHGAAPVATEPEVDNTLRFFEAARRVLAVPTVRRLLVAYVLFGMFLAPLIAVLSFYLSDAFHLSATGRALYTALLPGPAIIAMLIFGRHGERWYAENPARLLRYTGLFLGTSVALMATSIGISNFIGYTVVSLIAYAGLAVGLPAMGVASLGLLPPQVRAHASALSGIAIYGAGALVGTLFLSGIDSRYGVGAAIVALAVPGVGAGIAIYSAHRTVNDDLDAFVNDVVEEEELHQLVAAGARLPMLACRHIDFAYDQLQVLFDVSFSVEEGEMLALLGTNGAGKSTLLRVISGLGLPSAGSVRMRGSDITYLDPKRRVDMGIMQIAGGKGTFPRLTVLENLRAFGYPHGNDRAKVEAGIEAVFDAFPRLAERRTQRAGTMSGGENQMLALGCAFIVKPRILLIDELSLGLAPKVVGELLEMVRRINAGGSAVVLVEQSVNIALSLVDHAYFMEKGQIKFDGPAKDLLARTDLLRSVFLQGAAKGMAAR